VIASGVTQHEVEQRQCELLLLLGVSSGSLKFTDEHAEDVRQFHEIAVTCRAGGKAGDEAAEVGARATRPAAAAPMPAATIMSAPANGR
jgi:hypothetical protein